MQISNPLLVGKITHLSTGGIDLASMDKNQQRKTAGMLVVQVEIPIPFVPESRLQGLYRIVDPTQQALVEAIAADEQAKASGPMIVPGITK
jgi:6-phosphogluconolactonase (cycloisomerase 2 family)